MNNNEKVYSLQVNRKNLNEKRSVEKLSIHNVKAEKY